MLMGIFSAMGVCAAVFGGEIVDTVLSAKPEPNRTHPAFILFMLLMIPGMLVGAIGGFFGIVFPLHRHFDVPLSNRSESTRVWLHAYAKRLLDFAETKNGESGPRD
jgi:hypothetical protein